MAGANAAAVSGLAKIPGSGGVSRGRGDAELTLGPGDTGLDGSGLESRRLTPAEFADLEQSALLGVSSTTPEVSGSGGSSAGRQETAGSVGASTFKRRLVPRHRRAVSEFFSPKGEGKK